MSIRKQYDTDLESLKNSLTEMGRNSADAVENALEALCVADADAAAAIVKEDARINNMERDIEHRCMTLLLRQQPVAGDLRRISTAMKVVTDVERIGVDTGSVCYVLAFPRALYYDVISEQAGVALHSDGELISFLADMGRIQADYQHIRSALNDVRTKGYGVVAPAPGDLQLAEPEIVRKGGRYGVRLKASAKAIHMFQTNIETEISPEIGGENASSEILGFLLQGFDGDVEQLWQSNIFGKQIYTIAQEGVEEKLSCLPTKAVGKLQETLQRVVNEGSGTLICIIL